VLREREREKERERERERKRERERERECVCANLHLYGKLSIMFVYNVVSIYRLTNPHTGAGSSGEERVQGKTGSKSMERHGGC
jgi:hypothetical protein